MPRSTREPARYAIHATRAAYDASKNNRIPVWPGIDKSRLKPLLQAVAIERQTSTKTLVFIEAARCLRNNAPAVKSQHRKITQ
jgi:uncharacterized protein (DUF2235 family)